MTQSMSYLEQKLLNFIAEPYKNFTSELEESSNAIRTQSTKNLGSKASSQQHLDRPSALTYRFSGVKGGSKLETSNYMHNISYMDNE